MAGRIPREFIDSLLQRSDIVDIINSRVPLKKAGKDYQACCPFHDEKTPSFTVSPNKQFYHCFGCGANGSAINFLMEFDHLDFVSAIEQLAQHNGLEIPYEKQWNNGPDLRPLYQLTQTISEQYYRALQTNEGKNAIDYLKKRGLSGITVKNFQIGYAPAGWRFLLEQYQTDKKSLAHLTTLGMIVDNEGKRYDRFRDRVIFPIRDSRGRVIGFGGRVLTDEKPKYLNSPETPLFHKSDVLYGLYELIQYHRNIEQILVVEGYMDVVALAQADIHFSVATLGTAATTQHMTLLFKHSHRVVFCFDGDKAGRDAAWKALLNLLSVIRDGHEALFMFLPDGQDPDSLVQHEGKQHFLQRLDHATTLSDYIFEKSSEGINSATTEGRARIGEKIRPLIEKLSNSLFRDMLEKRLMTFLGLAEKTQIHNRRKKPAKRFDYTPKSIAQQVLAMLIQHPQLLQKANTHDLQLDESLPATQLFRKLSQIIHQQPDISCAMLCEYFREKDNANHINKLAGLNLAIPTKINMQQEFSDALQQLQQQQQKQAQSELFKAASIEQLTEEQKDKLRALTLKRKK